ncbi:MAG: (2Fe-2S) ferredoxin domain-containing protein [Lachnospiraceae bacterium]|nr:(2Fe-2S) ferredoxin domain-containing protein [Lachnospiraceae bacterium]
MVFVEVCVGSSCFLKGSEEVISRMQKAIEARSLEDEVILTGSFCTGACNRVGVTVKVNDEIFSGITPETFDAFFEDTIVKKIQE